MNILLKAKEMIRSNIKPTDNNNKSLIYNTNRKNFKDRIKTEKKFKSNN